ncbi:MAG: RNA-binding S4 domain-containing protein [Rhodospirillales bacterium]
MNAESLRVDKWLWYARFFKSRTLATRLCASRRLRINGTIVTKPHHALKAGDVLTFPLGRHIRVIRVSALGARRGPATEAQTLYEDLEPPQARTPSSAPRAGKRERGAGRPTKAERRATDRLKEGR